MTHDEFISELASEGLRITDQNEAGWTVAYYDESGERLVVWVTDEVAQ